MSEKVKFVVKILQINNGIKEFFIKASQAKTSYRKTFEIQFAGIKLLRFVAVFISCLKIRITYK